MLCVAAYISDVELLEAMNITLLSCGVAAVAVLAAIRYRRKAKSLKSQVESLNFEVDMQKYQNSYQSGLIEDLQKEIKDLKDLGFSATQNLKINLCALPNSTKGRVCVMGVNPSNPHTYIVIKSFDFDANDPDGYDFALLEAEELIEKIQE